MITNGNINILLVEDNPGDIRLTQEAFKEGNLDVKLTVKTDGESALDYLMNNAKIYPDLILLDLNLPKKDGLEVLDEIKNDDNLKQIPVIILTTSKSKSDIKDSYLLHANSFLTKPVEFDKFLEIIHKIEEYWLGTTLLP